MCEREIRNRIPSIHQPASLQWESSRDRDMIQKEQHKIRADGCRQAKHHKLERGDVVLMKNIKMGAYEPYFSQEEFDVTDVSGGEITVRSKETGKMYKRNSSHLKKLMVAESSVIDGNNATDSDSFPVDHPLTCKGQFTDNRASERVRRRPARWDDFVVE